VRTPDERRLEEALRMLDARPDATPTLAWSGARLRRYAGRLMLEARAAPRQAAVPAQQWDWRQPLALPGGSLAIRPDAQGDLDLDRLPASMGVRMADPGAGGRRLRKLMQDLKVPKWQRAGLPLLYDRVTEVGDGLAARQGAGRLLAIRDLWLAGSLRSDGRTRHRGRIVWS
jgi:tRNA(Ile)-lysidine synthase